jgi:hypothetical protein
LNIVIDLAAAFAAIWGVPVENRRFSMVNFDGQLSEELIIQPKQQEMALDEVCKK